MPSMTMKLSSPPDTMAGRISGKVTVSMVRSDDAPDISAASSRLGSMFFKALDVNI